METPLFSISGALALTFGLAILVNLIYYLRVYTKLAFAGPAGSGVTRNPADGGTGHGTQNAPVSVIIAARNEADNLRKFLPAVLEQQYPEFEVIVVNDCSYDDSGYILRDFQSRYPHLKVVEIPENDKYKHGKKFAITLGVKAASHEILLFTDADCYPVSEHWIARMQQAYDGDTEIVLGFSPYKKKAGPLNAFIRYETFCTALSYFSFALLGKPYMGVGRNLSYRRSLFFKQKGFATHLHLKSGDDDLFVNKSATSRNTRVAFSAEAHIISDPKRSWNSYFRQKRRHQSVGKYYKRGHKFLLSINPAASILFYALPGILPAFGWELSWVAAAAGVRVLAQYVVYWPAMKKLRSFDLWVFTVLLDIFYHLYMLYLFMRPVSGEQVKWK